jgi:hypothetical protein
MSTSELGENEQRNVAHPRLLLGHFRKAFSMCVVCIPTNASIKVSAQLASIGL